MKAKALEGHAPRLRQAWRLARATVMLCVCACGFEERDLTKAAGTEEPAGASAPPGDGPTPGASNGDESSTQGDGLGGGSSATQAGPARLSANQVAFDFGGAEAAAEPAQTFDWVITNGGGVASGALTLINDNEERFRTENGCTEPLAAGESCTVRVAFAPDVLGPHGGNLRLDGAAEVLTLALLGKGQSRMTIRVTGNGEVTSSPAGLTCAGAQCTGLFDSVVVTFTARTGNGSGSFLSLWNVDHCRARQACPFTMSRSGAVNVRFTPLEHNLVFTSSARYKPNLGGLAAYDAECNRLANAAGINDASGNAFIAAMSDGTRSLRQRLGNAQGWVRMDGLPIAETAAELFDDLGMRYYIAYDESGAQVPAPTAALSGTLALNVLTGTLANGNASPNHCNGWTSAQSNVSFNIGRSAGGPASWVDAVAVACDSTLEYRVVCMGVSRSGPLPEPVLPATGGGTKLMWVTNTQYAPGSMTPDQKCQSERPPGVASGVAFVAYTDRSAASVLDPAAVYLRPDGELVGTGAQLALMDVWTAPWLRADGSLARPPAATPLVWSGAVNANSLAQPTDNCSDWRASAAANNGIAGDYARGGARFFYTGSFLPCSSSAWLYCVEP